MSELSALNLHERQGKENGSEAPFAKIWSNTFKLQHIFALLKDWIGSTSRSLPWLSCSLVSHQLSLSGHITSKGAVFVFDKLVSFYQVGDTGKSFTDLDRAR
jgi:hypothetical protein